MVCYPPPKKKSKIDDVVPVAEIGFFANVSGTSIRQDPINNHSLMQSIFVEDYESRSN